MFNSVNINPYKATLLDSAPSTWNMDTNDQCPSPPGSRVCALSPTVYPPSPPGSKTPEHRSTSKSAILDASSGYLNPRTWPAEMPVCKRGVPNFNARVAQFKTLKPLWTRELEKLGFRVKVFPESCPEHDDLAPQPSSRNPASSPYPSFPFLAYALLLAVPDQKLKLCHLYSLIIAWVDGDPGNKLNNSLRHSLTTNAGLVNDKANGLWTIATGKEYKIAKKAVKTIKSSKDHQSTKIEGLGNEHEGSNTLLGEVGGAIRFIDENNARAFFRKTEFFRKYGSSWKNLDEEHMIRILFDNVHHTLHAFEIDGEDPLYMLLRAMYFREKQEENDFREAFWDYARKTEAYGELKEADRTGYSK